MTDIGRWLGVNKANVTRLVDGLERDGLVLRIASASDRRTILVNITPSGRERLDTALPHHLKHLSDLLGPLSTDEKRMLIHLLARAREAMLSATSERERPEAAFPV